MSRLREMIQELCPDGVEYRKLGEISSRVCSGGTPQASNPSYYTGNIPWLRTQEVNWGYIYDTDIKISKEALQNSSAQWISENCVIVAMYGATAAKVAINRIPLTTNQACCNLKINEKMADYKYVYYWLSSQYEKLKAKGQGSQSNINKKIIEQYPIPVPPLPIQNEIVKLLDNFTELTAELTAELTLRKKQYEYYRARLLSFEKEQIEWVKIESICSIQRGRVMSKGYIAENKGNYPVYSSQTENNGELGRISSFDFEGEYLTWTTDGANAGTVFYRDGKFSVTNVCGLLKVKSDALLTKYLYYVLSIEAPKYVNSGMGNPKLMSNVMACVKIPLPLLKRQKEIVTILDRFDTLCNDLTQGLPAEIAARKKQYEYYRDKLLTFRRKEA